MKETEVKIFNINKEEIEEKLISLGAKKVFDDEVESLYFDFPNNSIRDRKQTLRLRKMGNKAFLTFKNTISNDSAKIRDEVEIEVSDFEKTRNILKALGLSEWLKTRKHRTSYKLKDARFEIDKYYDEYDFIPEFLEIETDNVKTLYKYVELLGFKREDCKPWTILDFIRQHNK